MKISMILAASLFYVSLCFAHMPYNLDPKQDIYTFGYKSLKIKQSRLAGKNPTVYSFQEFEDENFTKIKSKRDQFHMYHLFNSTSGETCFGDDTHTHCYE